MNKLEYILMLVAFLLLALLVLCLAGCSTFGAGEDRNVFEYKGKDCTLKISQKAILAGQEAGTLAETIKVNSDCSVELGASDEMRYETQSQATQTPADETPPETDGG